MGWNELDLLLTGGRLGPMKQQLVEYGTFGNRRLDEDEFNSVFRNAGTGIIRRECQGCRESHKDIYIKVASPGDWNAYRELLVLWTAAGARQLFNLYSTLGDARQNRNPWTWFNGNGGVGFPRDSGPTGRVNWQWNVLAGNRGQRNFRFSVLQRHDPREEDVEADTEQVKIVEEAIMLTPHFHTLGPLAPLGARNTTQENENGGGGKPYKALVILFCMVGLTPSICSCHWIATCTVSTNQSEPPWPSPQRNWRGAAQKANHVKPLESTSNSALSSSFTMKGKRPL